MKTTAQAAYMTASPPWVWNHLPNTAQGTKPATLTTVKPMMPRVREAPSEGTVEPAARARVAMLVGSSWNQLMAMEKMKNGGDGCCTQNAPVKMLRSLECTRCFAAL